MAEIALADCGPNYNSPEYHASALQRLLDASERNANGCLECSKGISITGYSTLSFGNRTFLSHRLHWLLVNGEIPDEMTLDHLCYNRRCIELSHLSIVTREENALRAAKRFNLQRTKPSHCHRGHEYLPNDWSRNGWRSCSRCEHERSSRRAAEAKRQRQLARSKA